MWHMWAMQSGSSLREGEQAVASAWTADSDIVLRAITGAAPDKMARNSASLYDIFAEAYGNGGRLSLKRRYAPCSPGPSPYLDVAMV